VIRDAAPADFSAILALNAASEHFLSPMNSDRLTSLHRQAAYHRVQEIGSTVAAFLLAFREGADYDSPNYLWFAERYAAFLYVDRIVVSAPHRGKRLGPALYEDLFAFARRSRIATVTCEFDIDPPNETSRRFHATFGFREVGTQWVANGKKQVSLQEARLTSPGKDEQSAP
jgi:predicted GNAT superfamily acetyltransferase